LAPSILTPRWLFLPVPLMRVCHAKVSRRADLPSLIQRRSNAIERLRNLAISNEQVVRCQYAWIVAINLLDGPIDK
jgi:hypothetical protein